MLAYRRRADERGHVGRDAAALELLQILREGRPGDVVLDVAHLLDHAFLHGVVERTHRAPFAEDLECHTLADVALRASVGEERFRRPRQHVDEAWRDGPAGGIRVVFADSPERSPTRSIRSPLMPMSTRRPADPVPS